MNRIATRTMTLFLLCTFLLGGFGFFLAEYFVDSEAWVLSSGSPHIYTGENIACGVVVDRNGKLLLDMNDGRKYSNVPALRQSTVHWIGDRYGSVSAPALQRRCSILRSTIFPVNSRKSLESHRRNMQNLSAEVEKCS